MDQSPLRRDSRQHFGWAEVFDVLGRNLKWLITLPLLAGIAAAVISWSLPKVYTSVSVLSVSSATTETDALSPAILDQVLTEISSPEATQEERRRWLSSKILLSRVRNSSAKPTDATYMSLKVTDTNPQRAQNIAKALSSVWIERSKPVGTRLDRLKGRLDEATAELREIDAAIKKFESDGATSQEAEAIATLMGMKSPLLKEIALLHDMLDGLDPMDLLVSPPSLPDLGAERIPYAGQIAGFLALAVLIFLMLGREFIAHYRTSSRTMAGAPMPSGRVPPAK